MDTDITGKHTNGLLCFNIFLALGPHIIIMMIIIFTHVLSQVDPAKNLGRGLTKFCKTPVGEGGAKIRNH